MMDDEVSCVLRHFRPKPEFIANHPFEGRTTPRNRRRKGRNNINQSSFSFAGLRYNGQNHTLRLSYLHGSTVLLKFDVSSVRPISVTCAHCPDAVRQHLGIDELCRRLSANDEDSSQKNESLFSVVSRLLQSLNNDLPTCAEDDYGNSSDASSWIATSISQSSAAARRILHLEILLLRCAAAGRSSATLCTPVPQQFAGDEYAAHRVLALTDRMTASLSPLRRDRHVRGLLAFLLSMPWAEEGSLKVTTTATDGHTKSFYLCLDMDAAIGEGSPRFAQLARRRGTAAAFHGTKIENVWSILNYGLQNLSNTRLRKNGAIMGDGVYLSASYDVASFFAKTGSKQFSSCQPWRHPSLLRLLGADENDASLLDDYTVSCYPVFEARIIAPPGNEEDGREGRDCTRREGKYYVVPDSDDIRITKLHLTLDLTRKRSTSPFLLALIAVVIACLMFRLL